MGRVASESIQVFRQLLIRLLLAVELCCAEYIADAACSCAASFCVHTLSNLNLCGGIGHIFRAGSGVKKCPHPVDRVRMVG